MESFYFGPPGRRLFGVYHPPAAARSRDCGVVLVHPLGQEQIRAQSTLRRLAALSSAAGFPTLRFDSYGAGDSEGDPSDVSLARWRDDVRTAAEELTSGAGVPKLCLLGLRVGASVALEVGFERPDVASVVAWEPIVSGAEHLKELRAEHRRWLEGSFAWGGGNDADAECMGFALTDALYEELGALDLLRAQATGPKQVLVVDHGREARIERLFEHLRQPPASMRVLSLPSRPVYRKIGDPLEDERPPIQVLEAIVAWLEETSS